MGICWQINPIRGTELLCSCRYDPVKASPSRPAAPPVSPPSLPLLGPKARALIQVHMAEEGQCVWLTQGGGEDRREQQWVLSDGPRSGTQEVRCGFRSCTCQMRAGLPEACQACDLIHLTRDLADLSLGVREQQCASMVRALVDQLLQLRRGLIQPRPLLGRPVVEGPYVQDDLRQSWRACKHKRPAAEGLYVQNDLRQSRWACKHIRPYDAPHCMVNLKLRAKACYMPRRWA